MLGGAGSVAARRRASAPISFLSWPCLSAVLLVIVLIQFWTRSASSIDCQAELSAARKALQFRDDRLDVMAAQLRAAKETVERLRSRRAAAVTASDVTTGDKADHAAGAWSEPSGAVSPDAPLETVSKPAERHVPALTPPTSSRFPAGIEPAPADPRQARALLVICYNRPDYLRRTLSSVLERLPAYNRPHVYISQDGEVPGVTAVIKEMQQAFAQR